MLTHTVAMCIPSVRIVKIAATLGEIKSFWFVLREPGSTQGVNCTKWSGRQSTVMKEEMLDQHECEDVWFADY